MFLFEKVGIKTFAWTSLLLLLFDLVRGPNVFG